jgi:diaminopimelate epimerase
MVDGVNVIFVHCLEPGSIYVNTYEPGVGFTNACGTAMSAPSLVSILQNHNDFNSVKKFQKNKTLKKSLIRLIFNVFLKLSQKITN